MCIVHACSYMRAGPVCEFMQSLSSQQCGDRLCREDRLEVKAGFLNEVALQLRSGIFEDVRGNGVSFWAAFR